MTEKPAEADAENEANNAAGTEVVSGEFNTSF